MTDSQSDDPHTPEASPVEDQADDELIAEDAGEREKPTGITAGADVRKLTGAGPALAEHSKDAQAASPNGRN